jgi:hypothetical protein
MDSHYIAAARLQQEDFKDIMRKHKQGFVHPAALLFLPDDSRLLIVMEFRSKAEEEIVLRNLAAYVRESKAKAVILFGTAQTFIATYGADPVWFLFASIYVPSEKVYTLGHVYTVIEGEPIFGEEFNSGEKEISPWQFPAFWETST